MRIFFVLFVCSFLSLTTHGFGDFTLKNPKGWDCITDTEQLPTKIKMICIAAGKWDFTPSINLASEESDLVLDKYVKRAKEYHELTADTHCCYLGSIKTAAGEAKLLQIDRATAWGQMRFIQAAILIDGVAYVMTATCLQKDFAVFFREFFQSMKTFTKVGNK